jgi:hypothetical protein
MVMTKNEAAPAWFAPKRYGYGAGLPIAWQGWAVLAIYLALVSGATTLLLPAHWMACGVIVAASTAWLVTVSARRTRGGWRWRSGGE